MKILIVDDEVLARKRILKLLDKYGDVNQSYQASSGKEAILQINKLKPDIVFLDIQMTDMTGFEVLKKINLDKLPIIIFVTAFDTFAVKAFEVRAFDFLLKPYKNERFDRVLSYSMEQINQNKIEDFRIKIDNFIADLKIEKKELNNTESDGIQKIVIKVGKKYYFLNTKDIIYIISSGYYAEIFKSKEDKHIYRISMSDFMKKLDSLVFIRVNRSSILRISEIREIISEGLGDYSIIMNNREVFALSRKYREHFLQVLKIKNTL